MVEPIVQSTFGPRVGHEILPSKTTPCRAEGTSRRLVLRGEAIQGDLPAPKPWEVRVPCQPSAQGDRGVANGSRDGFRELLIAERHPDPDQTTDILVVRSDGLLVGSEGDDPPDLCALTRDAVIRVLDAPRPTG